MNKKDAYYFSHDSNARHDIKITAMRSDYGAEGYGWYWILIETMREQEGYRIPVNDKFSYRSLAHELGTDHVKAKKFIDDCINEYELFSTDGKYIWSNSLINRMVMVDKKREQARQAVNTRWSKYRDKDTDVIRPKAKTDTDVIQRKGKESKVNESKVNEKSFTCLTDDKLFELLKEEIKSKDEFSDLNDAFIESQRQTAIDYCRGHGKKYKNYRSYFFNFLRNNFNKPSNSSITTKKKMIW
jgi:hypothetical protein